MRKLLESEECEDDEIKILPWYLDIRFTGAYDNTIMVVGRSVPIATTSHIVVSDLVQEGKQFSLPHSMYTRGVLRVDISMW